MAQWDGIGQAANVAQLVGVDALGLISTIVQAAQAVQRNKETCQELVQYMQLIRDLLRMLQDPEMMQRVEILNALIGLEGTLQEAYRLVRSCQDCTIAYRIFMGWKQTEQFRRVKKRIAKHLQFYPMISHADITRRLERLSNGAPSTCSSQYQDAEGVLTPFSSHSNPEARENFRTESSSEPVETFQAETESTTVGENQQEGPQLFGLKVSANFSKSHLKRTRFMKGRFRWGHWLPQKKVVTALCIHELIEAGFSNFHFKELLAATNNFARECRIESFRSGDIYKGQLENGLNVMIKNCSHEYKSDSSHEFKNEVHLLAKLQHNNIIKLIGCCLERGQKLSVYEYMANGSLADAIFGTKTGVFLNWSERFKIILGIARGVVYLHDCCGMHIVHRDLKPCNILLDSDMTPKITDFGIAASGLDGCEEHEDAVRGSLDYLDPEYMRSCIFTLKSDVYGFGITLLEITNGKRFHELMEDGDDPLTLWTTGRAKELIDPGLHDEPQMAQIMRCIQIALLCAQPRREDRPTMWDVLLMLSCESVTLPVRKPPESWQHTQAACEGEPSNSDNIERTEDASGGELSDSDIIEAR